MRNKIYIAKRCAATWLVLDLAAAVPLGYKLNKMLRLVRYLITLWDLETYRLNPGVLTLLKILTSAIMFWHWMACGFWAVVLTEEQDEVTNWMPNLGDKLLDGAHGFWDHYSHSFFFAVVATTGVGWDIVPNTPAQVCFVKAFCCPPEAVALPP